MSIEPNLDALSFDAVIPSALLFNENLEPNAIKLYAFVRGLTRAHGYCYATNEYLAKCLKSSESTVGRLLTSLKAEGFIEIQTNKQGLHWQRHIFVGVELKKSLRTPKNEDPPPQNQVPPSPKIGTIYKKYRKEDIECSKESSLKGAKEKSATPPPPVGFYKEKFEGKIHVSEENMKRLVDKFKDEAIVNWYAEKLYRYSIQKPAKFRQYKRHDMVIEDWIERDAAKADASKASTPALNDAQMKNWMLNQEVVQDLKAECPNKAGGLNFYYKAHVLKDKNDPGFDISGLVDHKTFCMQLEKHLKVHIMRERFPNG